MNFNSTTICGRLTKAPTLFAADGDKKAMAAFTVAVNSGSGDKERTTYFEVELRGQVVDRVSSYLIKGKEVLVQGTVDATAYMKGDGTPAASLKLFSNGNIQLGNDPQPRNESAPAA